MRDVQVNGRVEKRLVDSEGRLVDTTTAANWRGDAKAIFVMNADGELFVSTYQKAGELHHSTLAAGQPVAAAGEHAVIEGKLVAISNQSGHYQPAAGFTHQAIDTLRRAGHSQTRAPS